MNRKKFLNKTIWVIGANSDIAKALIKRIAESSCTLKLFSRNTESLQQFVKEQNIDAECIFLDISDASQLERLALSEAIPDGIIIAAGYVSPQNCRGDTADIERTISSNYLGCVILLEKIKEKLKNKGSGFICTLSSVGGERGKSSNSVYASAKSGLTCYLEGLEQELTKYGINVAIVKPAWVKTKMTADDMRVQKSFTSQSPEQVANKIYRAIVNNRKGSCYTSLWAFCIAVIIKLIPDAIYRHLEM